jgi:Domain of unknown function (DUF5605)/Domain of unknown function (DUF5060)/Protein of unknown function (DUF4038)
MRVDGDTPIGRILRAPGAEEVLRRRLPDVLDSEHAGAVKHLSLNTLSRYLGEDLAADLVPALAELPEPPADARARPERKVSPDYEGEDVTRGSATFTAPTEASRWGRVEVELAGPAHGNPFVDVELVAEVTGPGPARRVPGFYDGDGTYRIRLLADDLGEWSWRTISNARSLDGIEGSFTCTEPAAGAHGLVRVADTFHFAHDDGTPYRPVGTTCYAWTHQGEELEEQTLATLAEAPFNKLRMCVFPKSYAWNENEPELHPFPRADDGSWDTERFDPAFFRHLEQRVEQLGGLGIEADLILFHPYDRWGYSDLGADVDDRYVRYLVARLAALPNVWWSLANEWDFVWEKELEDWERIGELIQDQDPYDHLRSIHNGAVLYDHTRPWITHCSVQRLDRFRTAEATDEWRRTWGKPVVIDECAYEGDIPLGWGNITGEEMVRRFWEGAVRGGYVGHGETYLHPDDVLWWSKGGVLHGSSPERIAFLRQVLEDAPAGLDPAPGGEAMSCSLASAGDGYLLGYFGVGQPRYVDHRLPDGRWRVDVLDTWDMTVTDQGVHEGQTRTDLPGRPYIAIRMMREDAA